MRIYKLGTVMNSETNLKRAFYSFFDHAESTLTWTIGTADLPDAVKESPRKLNLRRLVDDLAESKEVRELGIAASAHFGRRYHQRDSEFQLVMSSDYAHEFFINSGVFSALFDGKTLDREECYKSFVNSQQTAEDDVLYMIPVTATFGVRRSLDGDSSNILSFERCIDFGDFEIRRFTEEELKQLLRWQIILDFDLRPERAIFGTLSPSDWLHSAADLWYITVRGRTSNDWYRPWGELRVPGLDARVLPEVVDALRTLALFEWPKPWFEIDGRGHIQKVSTPPEYRHWLRFPFSIEIVENPRYAPPMLPSMSSIEGDQCRRGLEADPVMWPNFDQDAISDMRRLHNMRQRLQLLRSSHHIDVSFLNIALDFLRLGVTSSERDSLLWNCIALEALFSDKLGVVESIGQAIKRVYCGSRTRGKGEMKCFKSMYSVRSEIVHGKRGHSELATDELQLASAVTRMMARDSVEFTINVLREIESQLRDESPNLLFTRDHFRTLITTSPEAMELYSKTFKALG